MEDQEKKRPDRPEFVNISLDIQPTLLKRLSRKAKQLGIPRAALMRMLCSQPLKSEEAFGKWDEQ